MTAVAFLFMDFLVFEGFCARFQCRDAQPRSILADVTDRPSPQSPSAAQPVPSKDLNDGQDYGGVRVKNPFREAPARL